VVGIFCIVRPEIVSRPFSFCYVARERLMSKRFFSVRNVSKAGL
jgi:hypothetical protein